MDMIFYMGLKCNMKTVELKKGETLVSLKRRNLGRQLIPIPILSAGTTWRAASKASTHTS